MTTTIRAHYDGKFIVPDEPVDLPFNSPLTVRVEEVKESLTQPLPQKWIPLNLPVNAELARAIAEEPDFDIMES
jgi:hypothetical protein